jgi:hypothetical protein
MESARANAAGSTGEMVNSVKLDGCITVVVPPERISEVGARILQLGIPCAVGKSPWKLLAA